MERSALQGFSAYSHRTPSTKLSLMTWLHHFEKSVFVSFIIVIMKAINVNPEHATILYYDEIY